MDLPWKMMQKVGDDIGKHVFLSTMPGLMYRDSTLMDNAGKHCRFGGFGFQPIGRASFKMAHGARGSTLDGPGTTLRNHCLVSGLMDGDFLPFAGIDAS
ncbi:MAG TPA: hypothetical protein VFN13_10120 [Rudaea sp.]|nr:hypothetical protein [Rudaea sp.]